MGKIKIALILKYIIRSLLFDAGGKESRKSVPEFVGILAG